MIDTYSVSFYFGVLTLFLLDEETHFWSNELTYVHLSSREHRTATPTR